MLQAERINIYLEVEVFRAIFIPYWVRMPSALSAALSGIRLFI